jgi:hypothetical protein
VNIHAVIFHRLSPAADFLLSSQEVPLAGSADPLAVFFGVHIKNALRDEAVKAARFIDRAGVTSTRCAAILEDEAQLVDQSRFLAQKLYNIVTNYRGNISEGNLAFCLFSTEWSQLHRLAILKLDPSEVLRPIRQAGPRGDYFTFDRQLDALPTTNNRLQKCAFVDPPELREGFEMLVVDRQSTGLAGPARFFIGDFLEADLNYTDAERTRRFYYAARDAHNEVRADLALTLTPHENELLTQARYDALSGTHLNVDEWLRQLPVRDDIKQRLTDKIQAELLERDFDIDPATSQQRTSKVIYSGDNGLRVEIQPIHVQNGTFKEEQETRHGQPTGFTIVTIKTRDWKEVSR